MRWAIVLSRALTLTHTVRDSPAKYLFRLAFSGKHNFLGISSQYDSVRCCTLQIHSSVRVALSQFILCLFRLVCVSPLFHFTMLFFSPHPLFRFCFSFECSMFNFISTVFFVCTFQSGEQRARSVSNCFIGLLFFFRVLQKP